MIKQIPLPQILLFTPLLAGAAVFQNHLKSGPQFLLLIIGGISVLSFQLNESKGSRVFFYVILGILILENAFQSIEWLRNFRAESAQPGMDLGSLISLFLSLIIAPIGVIMYHHQSNRLVKVEELISWCFSMITGFLLIKNLVS